MTCAAIVPMYNERQTCAQVLRVLLGSGRFSRVLAVDDGSTDGCGEIAKQAGAEVLVLRKNAGKGQAMRIALEYIDDPYVGFFDADLLGFAPRHVDRFFDGVVAGYDMVCGLRGYRPMALPIQLVGPLITGERIVRRDVLLEVPDTCWSGYAVETGINATVDRLGGRTWLFIMDGVIIRRKSDKVGLLQGLAGEAKMFQRIAEAKCELRETGGRSC